MNREEAKRVLWVYREGIDDNDPAFADALKEAGRDPATLELIVRANVEFSDAPLGKDRADFTGSLEQIAGDVVATRKLGAAELLFDVQFSPGVKTAEDMVVRMEQLCKAASQS